jgi:hypothetical protein
MAPRDPYVTQKLAISTYKILEPTPLGALRTSQSILEKLAREDFTDTENLSLGGAIHKRIWELVRDRSISTLLSRRTKRHSS